LHDILMLSRAGEWLFYPRRNKLPLAAHRATRLLARLLRKLVAELITRQLGLRALNLRPTTDLSEVSNQVTPGLFEAIRAGHIAVRHGVGIESLRGGAAPAIGLTSGETVPADVVVVATGYRPRLDFLDAPTISGLVNADGQLTLHRTVCSDTAPGLYFVGWSNGISGLTSAETSALWAAAHLAGWPSVTQRPPGERETVSDGRLTSVPGVTLGDIDGQLADMGHPLSRRVRMLQWLRPMDAQDYAPSFRAIRQRLRAPVTAVGEVAPDAPADRHDNQPTATLSMPVAGVGEALG
jgi:hypothetical protein